VIRELSYETINSVVGTACTGVMPLIPPADDPGVIRPTASTKSAVASVKNPSGKPPPGC
jgi:hypothetical protein